MKNKFTLTQRAKLAHEVYHAVELHVEVLSENGIGYNLAYLLGAILDPADDNFVDWASPCEHLKIIRRLFRKLFKPRHPVWQFIVT